MAGSYNVNIELLVKSLQSLKCAFYYGKLELILPIDPYSIREKRVLEEFIHN